MKFQLENVLNDISAASRASWKSNFNINQTRVGRWLNGWVVSWSCQGWVYGSAASSSAVLAGETPHRAGERKHWNSRRKCVFTCSAAYMIFYLMILVFNGFIYYAIGHFFRHGFFAISYSFSASMSCSLHGREKNMPSAPINRMVALEVINCDLITNRPLEEPLTSCYQDEDGFPQIIGLLKGGLLVHHSSFSLHVFHICCWGFFENNNFLEKIKENFCLPHHLVHPLMACRLPVHHMSTVFRLLCPWRISS